MKIRWLGHSAFYIEGSKKIYIDPFITGNPAAPIEAGDITEADLVLVTHAHPDHLGDAYDICKRTGATLVTTHEIAMEAGGQGVTKAEGMNLGGSIEADGIPIHMVMAFHSSVNGDCSGLIIEMDGKKIYHMGDTCLFSDLALVHEYFGSVDCCMCPMGDRYTMGPKSAAHAVRLVQPKVVLPMHYNTWPPIEQDAGSFKDFVGDTAEVRILDPGGETEL